VPKAQPVDYQRRKTKKTKKRAPEKDPHQCPQTRKDLEGLKEWRKALVLLDEQREEELNHREMSN
jgi:hypothetical protein